MALDGSARGEGELDPSAVFLVEELAKLWRVSPGFVRKLCRDKELRAPMIAGGYRITGAAANEYWARLEAEHGATEHDASDPAASAETAS